MEDLQEELDNMANELANLVEQRKSIESQESEIKINTSLDNKTNETASLENLNLELKQEIEIYKQKEKELIQIIETAEKQR